MTGTRAARWLLADRRRLSALIALVVLAIPVAAGVIASLPREPGVAAVAPPTLVPTAVPTASPSPSPSPTATPSLTPAPLLEPADLTGVLVAPELAHRLPIAVSIDDNRVARPQAGFNAAAIVWQAPADGYEVRYLFVYQEEDAPDIGPVRSARLYIAEWASEVRAALAHYGGDRRTRAWVKEHTGIELTSVDGIGSGNPAYHRIRERSAPHNAYTSTADLRRVALRLGAPETLDPAIHRRPFRDDLPPSERGVAQEISVPYRTVVVGYRYDPATNRYLRFLDGQPHVDPADGGQVTARTVVVLFMAFRIDTKIEPGHARPDLTTVGTGTARVYMEGRTYEATWSKASQTEPTIVRGADGEEMPFVRGSVYFQVVPTGTRVTP